MSKKNCCIKNSQNSSDVNFQILVHIFILSAGTTKNRPHINEAYTILYKVFIIILFII